MASFINTKVVPIKDGKPVRVETYNFNPEETRRSLKELEKLIQTEPLVAIKKNPG